MPLYYLAKIISAAAQRHLSRHSWPADRYERTIDEEYGSKYGRNPDLQTKPPSIQNTQGTTPQKVNAYPSLVGALVEKEMAQSLARTRGRRTTAEVACLRQGDRFRNYKSLAEAMP